MLTNRRVTIMLIAVAAVMVMGLLVTATVAAQAVRVVRDARTNAVHISEVLGDTDELRDKLRHELEGDLESDLPEGLSFRMAVGDKEMKWFGEGDGHRLPSEIIGHAGIAFMGDFEVVEGPGVVVVGIGVDSPAALAGVERGDIVLSVDGAPVNDVGELHDALEGLTGGDDVELIVLHGDDERTLNLTATDADDVPLLGLLAHSAMPAFDVTMMSDGMSFPPPMVDLHGLSMSGAHVAGVIEDGPAEAAGVEAGETITAVDGHEVADEDELLDVLESHAPGDRVTLTLSPSPAAMSVTVKRDIVGEDEDTDSDSVTIQSEQVETREVDVVLGEHPDDGARAFLGIKMGPSIASISIIGGDGTGGVPPSGLPHLPNLPGMPEIGAFELPDGLTRAVIVGSVTHGSPAADGGMSSGDFVTVVDGETVADGDTLIDAVQARAPGDELTITLFHPGDDEERIVTVTLAEHPDKPGDAYLGVGNLGVIEITGEDGERGVELWFHAGPRLEIHGDRSFPLPDIDLPDELEDLLDELHEKREHGDTAADESQA